MRIVVPGLLAGLLVAVGCSADEDTAPEVVVLVPTTEEGYVDDWRTANWPRAAERDENAQAQPATPEADDPTQSQEQTDSSPLAEDATPATENATDEGPPVTLAFDDEPAENDPADDVAAGWPCDSVNDMREVLQWSNATFSEGSKGSVEEMPNNFRAAVEAAQSRDAELRAAVASAALAQPDLAQDFETLEERHLWVMGEFEQVGNRANDAYEINTMGLEVFDSPAGVEWAARVDVAKSNIDNQLVPECGVAFDDPVS